MRGEHVIREAEFYPQVKQYWLLTGTLVLAVTVVGIPLLLLWLPLGMLVTDRYLKSISCTLTNRSLKVKRGMFFRQERTIPLEKITDLSMVQGPIMRFMKLEALSVETAGQASPTGGALVTLVGIVEARGFRDGVLRQKDALIDREEGPQEPTDATPPGSGEVEVLREIRDTLHRIEKQLKPETDK